MELVHFMAIRRIFWDFIKKFESKTLIKIDQFINEHRILLMVTKFTYFITISLVNGKLHRMFMDLGYGFS